MAIGGAIVGAIAIGLPAGLRQRLRGDQPDPARQPDAARSSLLLLRRQDRRDVGDDRVGGRRRRLHAVAAGRRDHRRRRGARSCTRRAAAPRGARRRLRAARHGRDAGRHDARAAARRDHDLRADAEHGGPAADDGRLGPRRRRRRGVFQKESMYIAEPALGRHRLGEDARGDGALEPQGVGHHARATSRSSRARRRCPRSSTRSCARAASFSTSATTEGRLVGVVDIHDIKESFPERELSEPRDRGGPRDRDPLRDAGGAADLASTRSSGSATSGSCRSWTRSDGPQVPRHRHAARSARRVRPRGPASATACSRACGRSARAGEVDYLELPEKHRVDRGGRPARRSRAARSRRRHCGPATASPFSP